MAPIDPKEEFLRRKANAMNILPEFAVLFRVSQLVDSIDWYPNKYR
jgi:hypothetical protein